MNERNFIPERKYSYIEHIVHNIKLDDRLDSNHVIYNWRIDVLHEQWNHYHYDPYKEITKKDYSYRLL